MKDINNVVETLVNEINEIPEDHAVTYEVWALGYNEEGAVTDTELFFKEFTDPDVAIAYAKQLTLADIVFKADEENTNIEDMPEVTYLNIEVETVINDEDDEFIGGTMNIGTIFKKEFWIKEDVKLFEADYKLLDDGTLEVNSELLKGFDVKDQIKIFFVNNSADTLLTYQIIKKTEDKCYCDFIC